MWLTCLLLSIGCLCLFAVVSLTVSGSKLGHNKKFSLLKALFAGVFVSALILFIPIHREAADTSFGGLWRVFWLSVFNAMQIFGLGCELGGVTDGMTTCPENLYVPYLAWVATLFVLAPIFTFSFVLSLFKNLSAYLKYLRSYFRDVYIFSELNEKSLILASDIKCKDKRAAVVFTDVFESDEEQSYEQIEEAKHLGAICFKKDVLVVDFKTHSPKKQISFFAIGNDETENLNQALKLIEAYKRRSNTRLYAFSTKTEGEILLSALDKGEMKVRRVNEVQSLVSHLLYEQGQALFESARELPDGSKHISAVVVGMGRHGTEMVKALTWFGQMDGYTLEINAFDADPLAEEKFTKLAPELMSPAYNGVAVEGEAQYKIQIHSGVDVMTASFAREIAKLDKATFVVVALGNDDVNINAAVDLRMYFERLQIHPQIYAIVYNSQQKKALDGLRNYRGQAYDITFIGDMESAYSVDVIIDSALENDALQRHLKWGQEEEFWTYEYNYRSSMASAIHMQARIRCGVIGAEKSESDLTEAERDAIEKLEHRRWNAYMRAEGYVYSGSKDKSSRNDLAKMHHDLVDFSSLSEEDKRKDSSVGTK